MKNKESTARTTNTLIVWGDMHRRIGNVIHGLNGNVIQKVAQELLQSYLHWCHDALFKAILCSGLSPVTSAGFVKAKRLVNLWIKNTRCYGSVHIGAFC